ncbi:MAG TPA: hypothetical protein VIP78_03465 [Candidatus Dormibacteraeota bacterium]
MEVNDQDVEKIVQRDEAGVGALLDTYLPAEELYLEAAAHSSGDILILTTASTTTPLK